VDASSANTAVISWETDEPSSSIVRYGVAPKKNQRVDDEKMTEMHSINITGLEGGIAYSFCVESWDESHNRAEMCDQSFTTQLEVSHDQIAPVISDAAVSDISDTSATVVWLTDEAATGYVEYGITKEHGSKTIPTETLDAQHSVKLSGLSSGTTYYVRIHSSDDSDNVSKPVDVSFVTSTESGSSTIPPVVGPVISAITVYDESKTSVHISWNTTIPADSQVEYGADIGYGETTSLVGAFVTAHDISIHSLAPNTAYHARVRSRDANGILVTSDDFLFETLEDNAGGGGPSTKPPVVEEIPPTSKPNEDKKLDQSNNQIGHRETSSLNTNSSTGSSRKVENVTAYGLDHSIILTWNPNSTDKNLSKAKIVRSETKYPSTLEDGELIYDGSGRIFSDNNLTNNKTYYYSIFASEQVGVSVEPVRLSVTPIEDKKTYSVTRIGAGKVSILSTNDFGKGSRGVIVEYLQKLLATDPEIYPEGLVTGYFGPLTEAALIRFQKANNIPATGKVDADVRAASQKMTLVQNIAETNQTRSDMKLGSRGENVKVLQIALVQLGYLQNDSITGYFGPLTHTAVSAFQRDNNIVPADGYFGMVTREKMLQKTSSPTDTQ
jgi:peptidoglycan hydrolase-like protein with peptidoglycan-binding domain